MLREERRLEWPGTTLWQESLTECSSSKRTKQISIHNQHSKPTSLALPATKHICLCYATLNSSTSQLTAFKYCHTSPKLPCRDLPLQLLKVSASFCHCNCSCVFPAHEHVDIYDNISQAISSVTTYPLQFIISASEWEAQSQKQCQYIPLNICPLWEW